MKCQKDREEISRVDVEAMIAFQLRARPVLPMSLDDRRSHIEFGNGKIAITERSK
jgi:hypothetical protein